MTLSSVKILARTNHRYEDDRWNRRSRLAFLLHGAAFRAADDSAGVGQYDAAARRSFCNAAGPPGGGVTPTGPDRDRTRGRARRPAAETCSQSRSRTHPPDDVCSPRAPALSPHVRYCRASAGGRHDVAVAVQQSAAGKRRAGHGGRDGRRGRRVLVRFQPQPPAVFPVRGLLRRPVHTDMLPHVLREMRPGQKPGRQDQLSAVRVSTRRLVFSRPSVTVPTCT